MPGLQLVLCFVYASSPSLLTLDRECVLQKPPVRTAVSADAATGRSIGSDHMLKVKSWALPISLSQTVTGSALCFLHAV